MISTISSASTGLALRLCIATAPLFAKDKPEPKPPLERAFERLIKESEKATSDEKAHATALWESLASVWAPAKTKTKKAA
jgi:hypothetical protein